LSESKQKKKKSQILSLILLFIAVGFLVYLELSGSNLHVSFLSGNEPTLHLEKKWVDINLDDKAIFNIYYNDLIQCTPDGIKRISQEGHEVWNQTYSMTTPILKINEPFIAVGEENGKKIILLNEKGLVYSITTEEAIVDFSISQGGYLTYIGETKDGHTVKAFDNKGNSIGLNRITYIEDAGYPLSSIISNDTKAMPISYFNPATNGLKSNIICLDLTEYGILKEDLIDFGIEEEGTIIPTIFYLQNNTLVAIGDDRIIWIDENKNIDKEFLTNRIQAIPWNIESKRNLSTYLALALAEPLPGVQGEERGTIVFYNLKGNKQHTYNAEGDVTYLYADDSMVIVGINRNFYGLDTKGKELFKYTALKDVKEVLPLKNGKKVAIISKDSVDLMEIKR
jgi:hypothetical protein